MAPGCRKKIRLEATGGAAIFLSLMLLLLPLQWIAAAMAAAAFHEFCHWLAVRLCGGDVSTIRLDVFGARMDILPMSPGRELFCALAGPVGALLLLPLGRWFPRTVVCAVFHSLYNLLPVYPLDGGRALRCGALLLFSPPRAAMLCRSVQGVFSVAVLLLTVYAVFVVGLGLLPVVLAAAVIFRVRRANLQDFPS